MPSIAILVGNSEYRSLANLDCCKADVTAMSELLEATGKYETIAIIENANANDLKEKIRAAVDRVKSPSELFFYYTGHGFSHEENSSTVQLISTRVARTKRVSPRPTSTLSCALRMRIW